MTHIVNILYPLCWIAFLAFFHRQLLRQLRIDIERTAPGRRASAAWHACLHIGKHEVRMMLKVLSVVFRTLLLIVCIAVVFVLFGKALADTTDLGGWARVIASAGALALFLWAVIPLIAAYERQHG